MAPRRGGFPDWIEWSGLPSHLNEKVRIGAWTVFRKIAELDCERNRTPDVVEISLTDLAERCGLKPALCRRIVEGLRRRRALVMFLPETDEEPALFQVRVPLETPTPFDQIAREHPELHLLESVGNDRYAREEGPVDPEDPAVRRVVDLYLDQVSLKMNSFILDELIFIAQRFPRREIERVFQQVAHLPTPSLTWIARELRRRHGQEKKPAERRRRRR